MRYGAKFRLTPPWPPGLESIKKSLLGPARYRQAATASAAPRAPYDDTLLVALALQSHLNNRNEGFVLTASGIELCCRLELQMSAQDLVPIIDVIDGSSAALREVDLATLCAGQVRIEAFAEGCQIRYGSWLCRRAKRGQGAVWNPAFRDAVTLLRRRQPGF